MDLLTHITDGIPRQLINLLIVLLGIGFLSVCILNKELRQKVKSLKAELATLLTKPVAKRNKRKKKKSRKPVSGMKSDVPPQPT